MTIYDELIKRVSNGEPFRIDFEKRTMKVGKDYLIKNGEWDRSRRLNTYKYDTLCTLAHVETMYKDYKHSLPSERSDSKRKQYFKTLSMDELTDEDLFFTGRREVAQARLEGFILCMVLMGCFRWDEEILGKWFWQSKNDPDLVILRSWIENK